MNQQIRNIINKQQKHELLKCADNFEVWHLENSNVMQDVSYLVELRKIKRKILFNKLLHYICVTCLSMYTAIFLFAGLTLIIDKYNPLISDQQTMDEYENSPKRRAERAIEAGDYDLAKQILDDTLAEHPDYWLYDTYAELYIAMDENDKAVSLLTDTIYNRFHVANMLSTGNTLYEVLQKIPPESLTTTAAEYQKCLADCNAYIEKYNNMYELIEQGSYYSALQICDELKADGAYDNYLYWYYYKCYVGLKAYDECESYLKSLYGKQTSFTDLRYPSDDEIEHFLDELKKQTDKN